MQNFGNLSTKYRDYSIQKCFIGHSFEAAWRDDIISACNNVLPKFNLEPCYASDYFDPTKPLRDKALEFIANSRYGIYDLSNWDDNNGNWHSPYNVLIEIGMAIILNRPMLLLRHSNNSTLPLPVCLDGVDLVEFSGEVTLSKAIEERIPYLLNTPPEQDWLNRYCRFGNRVCAFREQHAHSQKLEGKGIDILLSDGYSKSTRFAEDRREIRETYKDVLNNYDNISFRYLEELSRADGFELIMCTSCQLTRSASIGIYHISPQSIPDIFVVIGMSIALEALNKINIPKALIIKKEDEIPSLIRGYEVLEAKNTNEINRKLKKSFPSLLAIARETEFKTHSLPFIEIIPEQNSILSNEGQPQNDILLKGRYRIFEDLNNEDSTASSIEGNRHIYQATDTERKKPVTIIENLFRDEDYRNQFRIQAETLGKLNHPNIPALLDFFVYNERDYMVMESIHGEKSLFERMLSLGMIDSDEAKTVGVTICDALIYIHSRIPPVIHRNIKPGNIITLRNGRILLKGFDLLKNLRNNTEATDPGARAMTPGYAPPEQYGTARTDHRTDIYSLGATLYAALCGIIPEDGLARAMENATLTSLRKRNAKVTHELARVIEKAMEIDPSDRYQSAEEFKNALIKS